MPEKTNNPDGTVKRYAPPQQRNRMLNRRKSGGFHGELGANDYPIEGIHHGLVTDGSYSSEIAQMSNENRFEKNNHSHGNNADKCRSLYSRNAPGVDHEEVANIHIQNESSHSGLIPISGCQSCEAAQLLRWEAAMHSCNDNSIDLPEKAMLYSRAGGSSWGGHLKFPHQMFTGQIDFMAELRRAIHGACSDFDGH